MDDLHGRKLKTAIVMFAMLFLLMAVRFRSIARQDEIVLSRDQYFLRSFDDKVRLVHRVNVPIRRSQEYPNMYSGGIFYDDEILSCHYILLAVPLAAFYGLLGLLLLGESKKPVTKESAVCEH